MIINSLKLKNIRSYVDEEILFPDGSIMLSGDIGTGKTSILLSIEFALFGIIKGQVSGSTLLRHGASSGFVEMNFSLDKKEVVIRRSLKRTSKSVAQDSGYIVIDGEKQDLSPVELKSKILGMIGYPDELLTKSKAFIYRYTIYTPQEEMKHILFESWDERLNVLRRIFDIDKYKRVKDNTLLYIKELKVRRTELETRIEDLDDKKGELKGYDEKVKALSLEIDKFASQISEYGKLLKSKEVAVKELDERIKLVEGLRSKLDIKTNELNSRKELLRNNEEELKTIDSELESLKKELSDLKKYNFESLKKERANISSKREVLQENIEKIADRNSKFITLKEESEKLVEKVVSLDKCPVCDQKVDASHKAHVSEREKKIISNLMIQLEKLSGLRKKRREELEALEKKLSSIDEKIRKYELLLVKKERFDDYSRKKVKIAGEQTRLKIEIDKLGSEMDSIKKDLSEKHDVQKKALQAKQEFEDAREKYKGLEIKKAEFVREKQTIEDVRKRLHEEILKKEDSKKQLVAMQELQNWLMKYFLNIVYLIEKQIMLHVHHEFNEYFQEWFNILIEDENLNVRLDETFTPIIEQNGYETFIENLSGGERTSVALAYRLSLNKVINDFIGTIKTKDLLILDEPTDGFSSDQLDKIRELLEQIKIKQVILVSHEPKLESYVDHIIRVYKEDHVSRVVA